ncbi:AlbA family DNA-binding domain-containing protein [Streptomyces sp. NPDC002851]
MDVTWNAELQAVVISDGTVVRERSGCDFMRDSIAAVTLSSIHQALTDSAIVTGHKNPDGYPVDFCVISTPHDRWARAYAREENPRQYENFSLNSDGELTFIFSVRHQFVRTLEEFEERSTLYLRRLSVRVESVRFCGGGPIDPLGIEVELLPPLDWTVSRCAEVSEGLRVLLGHRDATPDTPLGAYTLLLAGKPEALLGQPESDWLEAKRKNYGISSRSQKYEFACDVTSLANSTDGGILVVGIGTERDRVGRDVLSEVTPCRPGTILVQTYAQVLHEKVVPSIEGLKIEVISVDGGDLLVVHVPPQPEEFKPFLVKGAIISERVTGSHFSIPQRRGSDKLSMSAEAVHSMLVAARAVLRAKDSQ